MKSEKLGTYPVETKTFVNAADDDAGFKSGRAPLCDQCAARVAAGAALHPCAGYHLQAHWRDPDGPGAALRLGADELDQRWLDQVPVATQDDLRVLVHRPYGDGHHS